MKFSRIAVTLSTAIVAVSGIAASPAQATSQPLPVPYAFLTSAVIGGLSVDADPPGANDWSCKPSAAHPRPVVLVHGLLGNKATNWQTFSPLLANNGYCVFALTYGQSPQIPPPGNQAFGGIGPIELSAEQLKTFIAKVLTATGSSKVDILGHSEGTLMPNYYAKFLGGASTINRYVSIAPLWHGTSAAGLNSIVALGNPFGASALVIGALNPYFAAGPQTLKDSAFINKMRSGGTPIVKGITYTNIVTRYDELVVPYTSGIEPGMTNLTVQDYCPLDLSEHFQIVADPVAAALVLNALDPAHPRAVPCRLVLPIFGTL